MQREGLAKIKNKQGERQVGVPPGPDRSLTAKQRVLVPFSFTGFPLGAATAAGSRFSGCKGRRVCMFVVFPRCTCAALSVTTSSVLTANVILFFGEFFFFITPTTDGNNRDPCCWTLVL